MGTSSPPVHRPLRYVSVVKMTSQLRYISIAKIRPIVLYLPNRSGEMSGVGERAHRDSPPGRLLSPSGRRGDPPDRIPPAPHTQPCPGVAHAQGGVRPPG